MAIDLERHSRILPMLREENLDALICSASTAVSLLTGYWPNFEPAIYFDGYGGMRHCDLVAVTASADEVLTQFDAVQSQPAYREIA